jgi:hypothetical protein
MSPSCSLKYRPPGGGIETCKDNYDSLEFYTAGEEEHKADEHGPFTTAAEFEASPFWSSVKGQL